MSSLRTAGWIAFFVTLLLPCFWTARVQGGDLGSHVYNAQLTAEVKAHPVPGVEVATQFHNVLFDVVLEYSLKVTGSPDLAGRIGVGLALLAFAGGVIVWARVPLAVTPLLVLVAHGWVLQAGFLNFYAGTGLMLAAAGVWRRSRVSAVALGMLAISAHLLGVALALGLLVVVEAHRRFGWRATALLAGVAVAGQVVVGRMWGTGQDWAPWLGFDAVQLCVALPLMWIGGLFLMQLGLLATRAREAVGYAEMGAWVVVVLAGISTAPGLQLPGYVSPLTYLHLRFSFIAGIAFVALAARLNPLPRWFVAGSVVVALAFLAGLWRQQEWLSSTQLAMERAVADVPARARVLSTISESGRCVNGALHLIDMACAGGRCLSWGNYEPGSSHFRLRQTGEREVVALNAANGVALEEGAFVVRESDLPVYLVTPVAGSERFEARALRVGDRLPTVRVCRLCK